VQLIHAVANDNGPDRGWLASTLKAYARWVRITGIFWVHDDAISPFRRQSTPFRSKLTNYRRQFPRISSPTAAATITVRSRLYRRAVPPFPRLPAPRALLPPGHMPSRHRMSTHLRARGRVLTRHRPTAPTQTGNHEPTYPPARAPRHPIIVLRAMYVYSPGIHRKVHYRHVLHTPRRHGVPL